MTDNDDIISLLKLSGIDKVAQLPVRPTWLPPLTPSKVDTVTVDIEQYKSPQEQSKSLSVRSSLLYIHCGIIISCLLYTWKVCSLSY